MQIGVGSIYNRTNFWSLPKLGLFQQALCTFCQKIWVLAQNLWESRKGQFVVLLPSYYKLKLSCARGVKQRRIEFAIKFPSSILCNICILWVAHYEICCKEDRGGFFVIQRVSFFIKWLSLCNLAKTIPPVTSTLGSYQEKLLIQQSVNGDLGWGGEQEQDTIMEWRHLPDKVPSFPKLRLPCPIIVFNRAFVGSSNSEFWGMNDKWGVHWKPQIRL